MQGKEKKRRTVLGAGVKLSSHAVTQVLATQLGIYIYGFYRADELVICGLFPGQLDRRGL